MTLSCTIRLICPSCDAKFDSTDALSTNTPGPCSTDLYQRARGTQPLHTVMHTCPSCGYTGHCDEFNGISLDEELKKRIRDRITPLLKGTPPSPAHQYEFAAWIAEWQGESFGYVGDLYLRAAWCCSDLGKVSEERAYRLKALEYFKRATEQNEMPEGYRGLYTYLIGELYRRVGESVKAEAWFDRVAHVTGGNPQQQWLVDLATQQKTHPKEFIDQEL